MRVLDHVWNLRSRRCHAVVEAALTGMLDRRDFRVVHYSVQGNHLHFLVEANGTRELSEGMQALSVRLAKGLNRVMRRRGRVFAEPVPPGCSGADGAGEGSSRHRRSRPRGLEWAQITMSEIVPRIAAPHCLGSCARPPSATAEAHPQPRTHGACVARDDRACSRRR
jgi:hypothetical protein